MALASEKLGVATATFITTLFCVALAQIVSNIVMPTDAYNKVYHLVPVVVIVTATPACIFVWSLVAKNYHLQQKLRFLVERDRLTDAATRDYFFQKMAQDDAAFGISLMVDIDHFKKINDTYGHLAGDIVIRAVADVLQKNVREQDIVCRFGGEEFVIFLSQRGHEDGFAVAERMREAIEAESIVCDGQLLNVTVSIGGSLKDQIATIIFAIKQADDALYQAKRTGRNKTVFSSADQREKVA